MLDGNFGLVYMLLYGNLVGFVLLDFLDFGWVGILFERRENGEKKKKKKIYIYIYIYFIGSLHNFKV
jgi:cytochrome bd-type quinol oxidase subunit 2